MNIIQIQERLKAMPKEAIIGYVQNPTGEVPSFLALGELERRKSVEDKFNAMKEPAGSVSEQIVQENMPMGLGAIAGGSPQPEMGIGASTAQSSPEGAPSMAAANSGIANLPTPEGNFAEGGIVAFADGGMSMSPADYLPRRIDTTSPDYQNKPWWQKIFSDPTDVIAKTPLETIEAPGLIEYDLQKKAQEATNKDRILKQMEEDSRKEMEMNKQKRLKAEADQKAQAESVVPGETYTPAPEKSMQDYYDEYKKLVGEDPYAAKREERLAKMDERAAKMEKDAPWLALTEAGLAIASGSSPYAIQNIGAGAQRGIESYSKAQDKMADMETKRYQILDDMAKVDRMEKMAAVKYGIDSKQFKETQDLKRELTYLEIQNNREIASTKNAVELYKAQLAQLPKPKDRATAAKNVVDGGLMAPFEAKYEEEFGANALKTEQYKQAYKRELDRIVNDYLSAGEGGTTTSSTSGLKYLGTE